MQNNQGKIPFKIMVLGLVLILIIVSSGIFLIEKNSSKKEVIDFSFPEKYNKPLVVKGFGDNLFFYPLEANAAELIQEDKNTVRYVEAYNKIDVVQTSGKYKLKEDIILKQPGHPLEFKYKINVENFNWEKDKYGNLNFYIKNNNEPLELNKLFTIPAPFMIDAHGEESPLAAVEMNLNDQGILKFTIDKNWLKNHAYPIILDPTVEISIINLHSYPETGDNWVVKFTTVGQADLKIIPYDDATVKEDEFTGLYCGNEKKDPQILAGDVIYYPDWKCKDIAYVVHKTLKKGVHTLKFEFGTEWAMAYNGSITEQWGENSNCEYTGVTEDTYIDEVQTDYNMGGTALVRVGQDTAGTRADRTMIKFNLDALDSLISSESQIVSASLNIKTYDNPDAGNIWVDAFRITKNWNGGTTDYALADDVADEVTWSYQYYNETFWTTAGLGSSDRETTYDDRQYLDTAGAWESFDVTNSVKYMFTNNQDYGWILISESEATNAYWRIMSSERTTVADRPYLSITYNPNSTPTITSASDSPDPVNTGAEVKFSVDWNDADTGEMVKVFVCKTNEFATTTPGCFAGTWTDSGVYTNRDPETLNYTTVEADNGNTRNYYVYVCDDGGACAGPTAGTFQIINSAPSSPTGLQVEGSENGVANITDTTPEFSAVYNDPDLIDLANKYCIQVNTAQDFSGSDMWVTDSSSCYTGTAVGSNINEDSRSPDFSYAGTALSLDGTKYYWRIWFWDDQGERSATSTTGWFTTANQSAGWGVRMKGSRLKGGIRLK